MENFGMACDICQKHIELEEAKKLWVNVSKLWLCQDCFDREASNQLNKIK